MLRRRSALKTALLITALALIALCLAALACGPAASPAASGGDSEAMPTPSIRWPGDTPSSSELATLEAIPTARPYPPGYIDPTDPPYSPPLANEEIGATLAANITTEAAQQAGGASVKTPTLEPTPTPLPLTEQVTQFAREMQGRYDIVARVRAGASRTVTLPDNVTWPANQEPVIRNMPGFDSLIRTSITAVTVYHGNLPQGYELVSFPGIPNAALDVNQEYIFFINRSFVRASDYPEPSYGKFLYNQAQLAAVGGAGGLAYGRQVWVVGDTTAWRVPVDYWTKGPAGSDLAAARAAGESLPLLELEAAIRRGLPE